MSNTGYDTFFVKKSTTKFVVMNTAGQGKRIRIFQYPILNGETRDLLAIPGVSEADLRHALLKGNLRIKLETGEARVVESNIDLLQFDITGPDSQLLFLQSVGVVDGLQVTGSSTPDSSHKVLLQLVHLVENGGPYDGFGNNLYREILPVSSPFPTNICWYYSSAKLKKIVEKNITYNASNFPVTIVWTAYDLDGTTAVATSTDQITYSGAFEISRVRSFS